MKQLIISIFLSLIICADVCAQNFKRPEASYNLQRAIEAMQDDRTGEALDFLNKELEESPKNGYVHMWMSLIQYRGKDYGQALSAANAALKYLPKKDVEYLAYAYGTRGKVYLALEDTIKGLADLSEVIRLQPKETDSYEARGQLYYEMGKYDLSDIDYQRMTELDPGETMGYMGLGRNANAQERWDEAIRQFSHVIRLAEDYSQGYAFRAEAYIGKGMWGEATDDIVKALEMDVDRKAVYLALEEMKEPGTGLLLAKMKVQANKSPNESLWPLMVAHLYENKENYKDAIKYYRTADEIDAVASNLYRIAVCYSKMGDDDTAETYVERAIEMDSTDITYLWFRASLIYSRGQTEEAIREYDRILALEPELPDAYHQRGWCRYIIGDMDGGIEDMTTAIALAPDNSDSYQLRGSFYREAGNMELAETDFRKIIEIEDVPEKYNCIFFAYEGLDDRENAIRTLNIYLEADSTDSGHLYNAACLYSRLGETDKALSYLERCLEKDPSDFSHMQLDMDLKNIRETEDYKRLMEKFQPAKTKRDSDNAGEEKRVLHITEIPFTKENGVCQVKCRINDLPLYFVFDTGASDVSLSMVEANFMMKNGYLDRKDVVGTQRFMDANGNVSEGTLINLREVDFGGERLTNVRASVVRNQKAPLLLGQSILGRLGKIEIDNRNKVIKVTR